MARTSSDPTARPSAAADSLHERGLWASGPLLFWKSTIGRRLAHLDERAPAPRRTRDARARRDGAARRTHEVLPTVPSDTSRSVTELLDAWGRGDRAALDA